MKYLKQRFRENWICSHWIQRVMLTASYFTANCFGEQINNANTEKSILKNIEKYIKAEVTFTLIQTSTERMQNTLKNRLLAKHWMLLLINGYSFCGLYDSLWGCGVSKSLIMLISKVPDVEVQYLLHVCQLNTQVLFSFQSMIMRSISKQNRGPYWKWAILLWSLSFYTNWSWSWCIGMIVRGHLQHNFLSFLVIH